MLLQREMTHATETTPHQHLCANMALRSESFHPFQGPYGNFRGVWDTSKFSYIWFFDSCWPQLAFTLVVWGETIVNTRISANNLSVWSIRWSKIMEHGQHVAFFVLDAGDTGKGCRKAPGPSFLYLGSFPCILVCSCLVSLSLSWSDGVGIAQLNNQKNIIWLREVP